MATATLEQAQHERHQAIEANRDLGVVQYKSGEKQSDEVWEVTEGYKYLPGGKVLGPGMRFHPTERQVAQTRKGKGGLVGKARELTNSERRDLRHERRLFQGADFTEMGQKALRDLPMTDSALEAALAAGLVADDFEGLQGEGSGGRYTKPQVDALIEARGSASDA